MKKQKSAVGRPRHVAVYESGPKAASAFVQAMRAIVGPTKRTVSKRAKSS